jgi:hypothetical protein
MYNAFDTKTMWIHKFVEVANAVSTQIHTGYINFTSYDNGGA